MPGDFITMQTQVTLEQFHAFRDSRPKEEKWELIAGVPNMMPPPTLVHRRIARNIETLLNNRLSVCKPEGQADREVGLLLPSDDKYNPEPDVTVIDAVIEVGQIYAHKFYCAAEVLSTDEKPRMLDLKLAWYKRHEPCLAVLLVAQDRMAARFHERTKSRWYEHKLSNPADRIVLPEIGDSGALAELYRHTPLAPSH